MESERIALPTQGGRHARAGWLKEEDELLWEEVRLAGEQSEPLRNAFERVALRLGRKPNSVRNYYYAQLKERAEPALKRAVPFETFSQDQVKQLLRQVLNARAQGESVRACVNRLAEGDKTVMLRLQNKYRSVIKNRPELLRGVITDMEAAGEPFVDPTIKQPKASQQSAEPLFAQAMETVQALGEPALLMMLEGLNQLLRMALGQANKDKTQELDRLNVKHDLTRIALDDALGARLKLAEGCKGMVEVAKAFLELTPEDQAANLRHFSELMGQQLATAESALS